VETVDAGEVEFYTVDLQELHETPFALPFLYAGKYGAQNV
jgi:hypothetical protein